MCKPTDRQPVATSVFRGDALMDEEFLPSSPKGGSKKPRIIVQHDYHDHSNDAAPAFDTFDNFARSASNSSFPFKLYEMLQKVEEEHMEHIVSWQSHSRCFVVHKPGEFKELLPRFFKLSKIASFQRQLNLVRTARRSDVYRLSHKCMPFLTHNQQYGFVRITKGLDRGG